MANAGIDQNSRATLTALSSVDGTTIIDLYADPVTHALLVDMIGGSGTVTSIATGTGLTGGTITTTGTISLSTALAPMASLTGNAGKFLRVNAGETAVEYATAGSGGTPASPDTSVQFNDGGSFGGDADFTWDKTANTLTLGAGTDIFFNGTGAVHSLSQFDLSIDDQATPDTAGGSLQISTGTGNGTGAGGLLGLYSAQGGATGNGGEIQIFSSDGGATSGNGGAINITAGNAQAGNGNGGEIDIVAGTQNGSGLGGIVYLQGGGNRSDNGVFIGGLAANAIFDTSLVASSDKTFTFPNASGTLVIGGGTASGTNTGDQTITLTGDVTGAGTGSFATTIKNNVALGGSPTTTTQSPSDNSTKIATTAYVDNAVLGQNFKEAVKVATTATLVGTYVNGASGVGATFTYTATGVDTIDGVALALGDRVLLKNQSTDFQNGIYTVTTAGALGVAGILTRATDADQSTDYKTGDSLFVTAGTTQTSTTWAYTGIDSPTMGSTSLTFVQVAGQGSFSGGNGITITGTSIAINTAVTADLSTSQSFTNKNLNSGTNTFPTFNQNTTGSAASLSVSGQTGLMTVTGLASTNRIKTVRDAADTILELGGSYTPSGTWTSLTMVTPVLGTPTSGNLANCTFPTLNQNTTGYASALKSATTTVDVAAATAPTNGQVLTATDSTHATWVTPSAGSATAYAETPTGTINSSNTAFTLAHTPADTNGVIVLLDGTVQYNGTDYTVSGTTITFTTAPVTGSTIFAYYNTFTTGGVATITGTANQVIASASTGAVTLSTPQDIGTGSSPQFLGINVGNASDTTLTRASGGVLAVEGVNLVDVSSAQTLTTKTLTSPKIGTNILDTNGNELVILTATASAVNEITLANGATGVNATITASGETNTGITITGKGTKGVAIGNALSEKVNAVSDGAGAVIDCSLGNIFTWVAVADRTAGTTTNATAGQKMIISFNASGGARTLTLPVATTGDFAFGSDITTLTQTASGKTDVIGCIYNSIVANRWAVVSVVKGY